MLWRGNRKRRQIEKWQLLGMDRCYSERLEKDRYIRQRLRERDEGVIEMLDS